MPPSEMGQPAEEAFSPNENGRVRFSGLPVLILTSFAVLFVIVTSWVAVDYVDRRIKGNISEDLHRIAESMQRALHAWHEEQEDEARIWAEEPALIKATERLVRLQSDGAIEERREEINKIRGMLRPVVRQKGYLSFFIIDEEYRVLASHGDDALSASGHLFQDIEAVRWAFRKGDSTFTGPLNVDGIGHEHTDSASLSADGTIFAIAPIRGDGGNVRAVLAFQIDLSRHFHKVLNHGRLGKSGETYAFDRYGRMVSPSRFEPELRELGLLGKHEVSTLNIRIADPGVDLSRGKTPSLPRDKWPLTLAASKAISGEGGGNLEGYRDYRGVPVIGVWSWEEDIGIGIASEIDRDEAYSFLGIVRLLMIVGAGISVVLLGAVAFFSIIGRRRVDDERARISAVVEHAIDGIIMIDQTGRIETANAAAVRIFGYNLPDLIGQNIKMLVPEPHRSNHDSYIKKYLKTGKAGIIGIGREVEGVRKDDSLFPMDLGITEVLYGGEKKFIGTVRDITERKVSEIELTRFKTTLDQIQDYVFMFDPLTLKFFYVNRGGINHIGYTESELTRMTMADIAPAFDLNEFREVLEPLKNGETPSLVFETFQQHKDGGLIPVEISLQYIDPDGESPRFVAIVRDVTERLKADEKLKRTASGLAAAQRIAHLGSWEWDIASGDLHWSDEIYRIFGLEPRQFEATYEAFLRAVHPNDRDAVAHAVEESLEIKEPYHITHRVVLPNGAVRTVEEQGEAEYDDSGNPVRMNGIVQDITERVAAESMKREFISTVSHELRTPLTAIHGSHGLLLGGVGGDLNDQAKRLLTIAHENSDRLIRLINDILDIEKLEAGKMNFSMSDEDAIDLIKKAIDANESYAHKFNVSITFDTSLKSADVYVDSDRFSQVMTNLISNAAKFSPKGSTIDISILDSGDGYLTRVVDHGPGIPEEFRNKIFSRFAQADSSDTRQKGGTGLGLSITRAIVEHMGGDVGFETATGEGTMFYFTLPKRADSEVTIESEFSDRPELPKFLICEDNRDVAMILREILKNNGFSSDIAHTAKDAKSLLSSNEYVGVTMDIILPDSDGFTLIKWMRDSDGIGDVPVIVISGVPDEEKKNLNGGAVHVVDWLSKPLDTPRLEHILLQLKFRNAGRKARVLHVEDDSAVAEIVGAAMRDIADITVATSLREAREKMAEGDYDLFLLDVELPDGSGLDLLPDSGGDGGSPVPVIIFSAGDFDSDAAKNISAILTKSRNSIDDLVSAVTGILKKNVLSAADV